MTFSDIESELGKLHYLTIFYQKSYMTFGDIDGELKEAYQKYIDLTVERLPQVDPIPQIQL